ncbi:MAG: hypothetical protein Q4A66_01855 [Eubacteriales bacterium]|nr:hypothetical protein [Eubacteriales bacterium]
MLNQTHTEPARLAAIDVGSNTIKMLAAEVSAAGISPLKWHSVTVRLQSGLLPDGSLDEAALGRAEEAIATLVQMARELHIERIAAFGTSALRDAKNAGELVRRVQKRCGVLLRVISGEEEAESAYTAAAPAGRALVINPGGGSTEIIAGEDGRVLVGVSAHVGAVSLLKETAGFTEEQIVARAKEYLAPEWAKITLPLPETVIASGGAATCAADVLIGLPERDRSLLEGFVLESGRARGLLSRLHAASIEERIAMPGMNPNRADILPCGLAILIAFMELSGAPCLRVSERSNVYGFLRRMAEE